MKQRIFILFTAILLAMAFPFNTLGNKVIDFNFPQDVSKQALDDLNKALKTGDGQQTVDALVRYSIAQSGISQDNMPDIIKKIESVSNKEKRPEFKALLYYFEAMAYQGYYNAFTSYEKDAEAMSDEAQSQVLQKSEFYKKIIGDITGDGAVHEFLKTKSMTWESYLKEVIRDAGKGHVKIEGGGVDGSTYNDKIKAWQNIDSISANTANN